MLTALAAHLPTAAATIRPLYAAAGGAKQGAVVWSAEMDEAYEAALALLSSPEVVVPFDESRPLLLLTDWSVEGGAGVFAHLSRDESHFEIVESFSHANSKAESNYGAAEGEISMVRLALKQFPHLMLGRRVYWVTDALTMRSAFEAFRTSASPRIRRTVAELQHVEIVVIDTPGRKHCIADALSRNPSFASSKAPSFDCLLLSTRIYTQILQNRLIRDEHYSTLNQFASARMHSVHPTDCFERQAIDVGDESYRYRTTV